MEKEKNIMFEQLWMSGILVAFSVFGIKAGVGLGAQVYSTSVSPGKKALFLGACFGAYLLLFLGLYGLVSRLNLLDYLDYLSHLLQYGMWVHLLVALGLLVWGIKLLLGSAHTKQPSLFRASLLLVVPCPVCATVILLNLTLALSLSHYPPFLTTLILFGMFMGIIVLTLGVLFPRRRQMGSGTGFLGLSMTLISLYFLMTVVISPLYPEIKAAFTMAVSNSPATQSDPRPILILSGISLALAGLGFTRTYFFKGDTH
jgi:predicted transporter